MDELNRPLGKKPAAEKASRRRWSAGTWLGAAGLAVALAAVGLITWQILNPPVAETIIVSSEDQVGGEPVADHGSDGEMASASSDDDGGPGGDRGEADSGTGIDPDSGGLVELSPNGSIAVPKPRPPRAKPQEAGLAHLAEPELLEEGATGAIPKRGPDGRRPMDVYAREPDTTGNFGVARVVLIVGGMGLSQTTTQQAIRQLPPNVVLAFAPYGNSLSRWMQTARKQGHELLLQIPMEPFGYPQNTPGERTLVSTVSAEENLVNLHWAMSRLTNYVGLMNYQGAKMLGDERALKPVFDEIAQRGLLFVDDGSANGSRAKVAAARSVLPFAEGTFILDLKRNRRDIADQIEALVTQAKRTGMAIGIASAFPETIEMLAQFASQAGKLGVEITPVSAVVSDPEREG